jgi:hypothetical protein
MTLTSEQLCFSLELAVLIQRASGQTTRGYAEYLEPHMTKLPLSGKYRVLLESSRNSSDRRLSKPAWRY